MASSLETNKILAAVLTAGIFASGAGVVSRILYHPTAPEEPAYVIEVAASGEAEGDAPAEEQGIGTLLASADAAAGEVTAKKCSTCHSFDEGGPNKVGPNLHGIVGREVGSVAGFGYSDAMAGHGGSWDDEALNQFLINPKGYVPGTKMAFAGIKGGQDRANVIMYLRSQSPDAPPMPQAEAPTQEADGAETQAEDGAQADAAPAATSEEAATEATEDTADAAADAGTAVADSAEETVEGAVEDGAALASDAADKADVAMADAADGAKSTAGQAADTTEAVTEEAAKAAETATAAAADAAGTVTEDVADATATLAEKATETADAAKATAGDVAKSAADGAKDAASAVAGAAGATVAAVTDKAADAAAGAGDASGLIAAIGAGDVASGEKVSKKCKACHVFEEGGKNRLGPALWDVVGRDVAAHEGFKYSSALSELGGAWTYERLNDFLKAPKTYVPGTKMTFAGVKKDEDLVDLLAYLRTLSNDPKPLADGS